MSFVDRIWYQKFNRSNAFFIIVLLPFTLLFALITSIRRLLYRLNILKSIKIDVPVIVVGGIAVGGTGKTPLSIALLKDLVRHGYKPGLISRGYRGKAKEYPFTVQTTTLVSQSGDEPLLIKMAVQDLAVIAVDPNRERGAKYLASLGCNVIVTDDGLQHYSLKRDIEIIVVDGVRGLGNGFLMPSGPLREGRWHLKKADGVVINGVSHSFDSYSMTLVPSKAIAIDSFCSKIKDTEYLPSGVSVYAMAGIGNPERFYNTVKQCGFSIEGTVDVADHGVVDEDVLRNITKNYPLVMTAKDAVKYSHYNLSNVFVINVEASLSDRFFKLVHEKLLSTGKK